MLIVEDDVQVAAMIRDALTDLGYESEGALNGPDALRRVPRYRPDAILLDLSMPGMSGVAVLEALRREHPEIPVVMVSGNLDEEVARGTLAQGAFDYVKKPFDIALLGRILAAAVGYRAP